jgi:hypothetical protein
MTKQQWLLTQIAQFPELSARELASKLNDKVVINNPEPQRQIPLYPTLEEVSALLDDSEVLQIAESPVYGKILDAIQQNRPDWVINNLNVLRRGGKLSQTSFDAILALLQRTQPDPDYQNEIYLSPAELAGFGVVLVNEIEELYINS